MGYNNSHNEFVEEKKENDSMNGANCSQNNMGLDKTSEDVKKPEHDDEKIKMMDSYDMEENEGESKGQHQQGQGQQQPEQHNPVFNFAHNQAHPQQQPQLLTNINNISSPNNGMLAQTAQQLLATSLNQQHQLHLVQQPCTLDTAALSILPQQTLNYLAVQSPAAPTVGSVNLLAIQNALAQQQHVGTYAQTLVGGGMISPSAVQHINLGQQLQSQQQNQQLIGCSGGSISSSASVYAPSFAGNIQPVAALSPTNHVTPTTATMPPLYSAAPFAAPSIVGPSLPSLLTSLSLHTLSPQLTIPHYIPPTPASWGAPLPTLTVQDRPLVPPIYNGINPNYPKAQMLHSHPPIFCVYDFLTPAECDFLIEAASDAFGPAPVVGKGQGEVSPSRTSSTCYLAREDLPEYLRKVSLLTGKPQEHCELPQVGRYLPSQQYLQHFDAFDLSNEDGRRFASNGGQRTVTVLTYLNDVAIGGATAFPNLNLQVQPRRGMALVFFPSTLDGLLDKMALHAALPAVDIKYVSQVWIRQTNYDGRPSKRLAKPMVAGLQEQREREELEKSVQAQLLMGQIGLQVAASQQHQQQQHHHQPQHHES